MEWLQDSPQNLQQTAKPQGPQGPMRQLPLPSGPLPKQRQQKHQSLPSGPLPKQRQQQQAEYPWQTQQNEQEQQRSIATAWTNQQQNLMVSLVNEQQRQTLMDLLEQQSHLLTQPSQQLHQHSNKLPEHPSFQGQLPCREPPPQQRGLRKEQLQGGVEGGMCRTQQTKPDAAAMPVRQQQWTQPGSNCDWDQDQQNTNNIRRHQVRPDEAMQAMQFQQQPQQSKSKQGQGFEELGSSPYCNQTPPMVPYAPKRSNTNSSLALAMPESSSIEAAPQFWQRNKAPDAQAPQQYMHKKAESAIAAAINDFGRQVPARGVAARGAPTAMTEELLLAACAGMTVDSLQSVQEEDDDIMDESSMQGGKSERGVSGGPTMKDQLQALQNDDPACILIARRIGKLGFSSAEMLETHFATYSPVKRVHVSHSRVRSFRPRGGKRRGEDAYWRLRAAGLGFIVMETAEGAAKILRDGPEHHVCCANILIQPFKRCIATEFDCCGNMSDDGDTMPPATDSEWSRNTTGDTMPSFVSPEFDDTIEEEEEKKEGSRDSQEDSQEEEAEVNRGGAQQRWHSPDSDGSPDEGGHYQPWMEQQQQPTGARMTTNEEGLAQAAQSRNMVMPAERSQRYNNCRQ